MPTAVAVETDANYTSRFCERRSAGQTSRISGGGKAGRGARGQQRASGWTVLSHIDQSDRATTSGIRRQNVEFDSRERHDNCRGGRGRCKTKEDRVRCWIARTQTRIAVVAGGCRPVVVVRRRTVMMVNVIVTTVRVHMDRGRPGQGPSHDDRDADVDGPTHGKSLSQRGLTGSQEDIGQQKADVLTSRLTNPVY